MPKEITKIGTDEKLNLIKAYRIANKRAGESRREGPTGFQNYIQYCAVLRDLKAQAESMGFQIWVMNGKTGHTYEKDYKVTPDEQNDYQVYQTYLQTGPQVPAAITAEEIVADDVEPTIDDNDEDNLIRPDLISDED